MGMDSAFSRCHPAVNFSYFLAVIGFSMFLTHPVCQLLSLLSAVSYVVWLNRRRAVRFLLLGMLPLLLAATAINPIFNHEGATILRYLPDGNPLTLEAILFGLSASVMMVTVITWFSCYNRVVTSDKLMYLFGRILPALSLIFSMTLRFVPRFTAQLRHISAAQRALGRDLSAGGPLQRAKNGIAVLSVMITWALESAVTTADSMKSRGYGLRGRTAFTHYRMTRRDAGLLILIVLLSAVLALSAAKDGIFWQYYPVVTGNLTLPLSWTAYLAWFALCVLPITLDWLEEKKWTALRSGV